MAAVPPHPPQAARTGDYPARLAGNLCVARSAAGLTQHQLARRSRISRATIAQLENGGTDPRLSTVVMLARALHVSPLYLLLGRDELESLESLNRPSVSAFSPLENVGSADSLAVADRSRELVQCKSAAVAAAIGAALHPGRGGVTAAAWAYLIERAVPPPPLK